MEELQVGDYDAVTVSSGEDVVSVWHVDQVPAFDAVGVSHVESDIVFDVEFPETLMVL